jgi:hypothetical protein
VPGLLEILIGVIDSDARVGGWRYRDARISGSVERELRPILF